MFVRNHKRRIIRECAITERASPAQKRHLSLVNHRPYYYKDVAVTNCVAAEGKFVFAVAAATGASIQTAPQPVMKNIFIVSLDNTHNG